MPLVGEGTVQVCRILDEDARIAYGVVGQGMVLVRPDGHVGVIAGRIELGAIEAHSTWPACFKNEDRMRM